MHFFCKTYVTGWWRSYSNIPNILIWVSFDLFQPWALEIHYIEKQMMSFWKKILALIYVKYFLIPFDHCLSWVYTYFHVVIERIATLHKKRKSYFYKEHCLNSIFGSKRPESNFVYMQQWFVIWNWLQNLCNLRHYLNERYDPIKSLKVNQMSRYSYIDF